MTTCEELDDIHMDTVKVANVLLKEVVAETTGLKNLALLRQVTIDFTIKLQAALISEGFTASIGCGWSDWEYRHDLFVHLNKVDPRGLVRGRVYRLVITIHPDLPTLIYSQGPAHLGTIRDLIDDIRVAQDKGRVYDYCGECHYYNHGLMLCGRGLTLAAGCTGYKELTYG